MYFILLREDGKVLKPVYYKKDKVVAFSLCDLLEKPDAPMEKSVFEKAYTYLKNISKKVKIPRRITRLGESRADKRKKNRFLRRQNKG
jgi:hypothetical protein